MTTEIIYFCSTILSALLTAHSVICKETLKSFTVLVIWCDCQEELAD